MSPSSGMASGEARAFDSDSPAVPPQSSLTGLIVAIVAASVLVSGCGGGSNDPSANPSTVDAVTHRITTFTVSSPLPNATVSGIVTVTGTAGSRWTSVSVVDMTTGNSVVGDAVPSGGAWTASVDSTGQIDGTHIWQFTATNSSTGATVVRNVSVNVSNNGNRNPGSIFYGVNGHNNEGGAYDISSPELQSAQLQDLGAKIYRNEAYSQSSASHLAAIAPTFEQAGVTIYPVMLSDINFASETDAYNAGYALGQQTASAHKYPYYEVSNELDSEALVGNVDGVYPQQYDNTKFQLARGVIRGMIAGVKSVDQTGKIIIGGGTWLHYGFDQMLANGTQPDGTTGHPAVNWDITAWHWYSDMNDITNACGGTGCHDVLGVLKQFGKPIWINEFGVRPWLGSDTQIASYLVGNEMMAEFVAKASTYNIQSIQVYELYDDPPGGEGNYGLLENDGLTIKPAYSAYKDFVGANPE